jgi:3-oxoacyl-[acyl-carrier protein] reductase
MTQRSQIDFNLRGRRALVTGSGSGIGLATAERLSRSGAHVAMNGISVESLETAVRRLKQHGLAVDAVAGDLSSSKTAREVAERAVELLGGLDYLVNNAGAPMTRTPIPPSDLDSLTDDFWDQIIRTNLLSAFWVTKAVAPALRLSGGAVVNTVSAAALGGGASSTAYATAKAGLAALTRELARGLAPKVRVNGISPSFVKSNWPCSFGDIELTAKTTAALARVGQPEEYAEVIVYLCAGASYITGEVIAVSGGFRL